MQTVFHLTVCLLLLPQNYPKRGVREPGPGSGLCTGMEEGAQRSLGILPQSSPGLCLEPVVLLLLF